MSDGWDIINIDSSEDLALRFFSQTDQCKYDFIGVGIGQLFNKFKLNSSNRWFCSEWCAAAIGLPEPSKYSPGGLWKYVKQQ